MKSLKSIEIGNEQAKNLEDIIQKIEANGVRIYIINKKKYHKILNLLFQIKSNKSAHSGICSEIRNDNSFEPAS
ncbi:hypothetical protein LCGC14_1416380 [marine sediment metagenome]|uniref:Uncharacterized protein n=1 Tax=marine sediment metagenome TaxID=412755 RepID=A0A0F9JSR1_9ZZZZ